MGGRLRGKVAIVAGAGSIGPGWGNGKATATIFAREGARVICADINRDAAEETAAIIQNEGGQAFAEFKRDLQPLLEKLGWWGRAELLDPLTRETREVQLGSPRRLRTIYDVNLRQAHAAGQWERIERTAKTHPYLLYELGPSREHRPEHVAWAGILLPADDPWWQTHFPPNGWGCKCRVRQVSRREAERLLASGRYVTAAPDLGLQEYVNRRTGQVVSVPRGIEPGWAYNAGQVSRLARARQLLDEKEAATQAES